MMNEALRLQDFSKLMEPASLTIPFVDWLVENGFFIAPASTKYHGAYNGGLYDHSKNVTTCLLNLTDKLNIQWQRPESPLIVGMFHDLCKIDSYQEVVDVEGETFFGSSEPVGREVHFEHADPLLKGHGAKSVMLLSQFMRLTPEEMMCIRFHMGAFEREDWNEYGRAVHNFPAVLWTHTADMMAARVLEV